MKKLLNIAIVIALWVGSAFVALGYTVTAESAESKLPFTDIEKHWAKDNIVKAYNSGLVGGFPDGTFRPDDVVTADQFVVMMLKAFSKTTNGKTEFDMDWLLELANVQPSITLQLNSIVKDGFNFKPATTGYWAKPFIDIFYEIGLLTSSNEVFPKDYNVYKKEIKREQASFLLGKWYTNLENGLDPYFADYVAAHSGMKDFDKFTNTSVKNYRAHVLIAGIMAGYPGGYFHPHRYVTRAEALSMAQRLRDKTLRAAYKPNLTGQYYAEVKGNIYLISDKFKYDMYKNIEALAKKHVTKGYIAQDGLGFGVYDSKDTADKNDFLVRMGEYDKLSPMDLSIGAGAGATRQIIMVYPINKKMPYGATLFDAILELLAGDGKGKEFKTKLVSLEKTVHTKPIEFNFNNKKFAIFAEKDIYTLRMYY